MPLYQADITIRDLINVPVIANEALLPVFYSGATYKITIGDLLAQVTKASIGLGNADNTSDANKPISTATAVALANKADISHTHNIAQVTELATALSEKALINHQHPIAEVVGLSATLDTKAELVHQHEITGVNGLGAALNAKADSNHVHEITAVNGLSLALASKADVVVVNTQLAAKADTVTVAAQLANKANTVDVNAQLAGKSNIGHTHTYADIAELDTDITNLFNGLDGKAPLNHAHVASNVSDFDQAVRTSVLSYLAEGTNINLVGEGPNLIINSTGGSGAAVNDYNAVKVFSIGGNVDMNPNSNSQDSALSRQIVLGRDLVAYDSYIGDTYAINEVGIYRVTMQTTAEVSPSIFSGESSNFVPQVFTKPELAIKHGHKVTNRSGLTVIGAEVCIERSIIKTQAAYSNNNNYLTAWNSEFCIEVTTPGAELSLASFLGFDNSVQDGTDVSINEWLAHHNTTVIFEAIGNPQTNENKAPGIYAALKLARFFVSTETSTEVSQWALDGKFGSAANEINSDFYSGTVTIGPSGTYRVIITCTVSRVNDGVTPNYPANTLAPVELITRTENFSGISILTEKAIRRKKIIDIQNFETSSETWICEFILSSQANAELQIITAFTSADMFTLGWNFDHKTTATFERLGDAVPAPI